MLEGYEGLFVENQDNRIDISPLKHALQTIYLSPKLYPLSFSRLMEE